MSRTTNVSSYTDLQELLKELNMFISKKRELGEGEEHEICFRHLTGTPVEEQTHSDSWSTCGRTRISGKGGRHASSV